MLGLKEWADRFRWSFTVEEAEKVARILDTTELGFEMSGDHHPRIVGGA